MKYYVYFKGDIDERGHESRVFTRVKDRFKQAVNGRRIYLSPATGECPAHLPLAKPCVGKFTGGVAEHEAEGTGDKPS